MAIAGYESFTYIGYTKGDSKPTLYFKEGRYTQVHAYKENVGWHPKHGGTYHSANISRAAANELLTCNDTIYNNFMKDFIKRSPSFPECPDANGALLEVYSNKGKVTACHISRSRLVKVGGPGFDRKYDEKYAKSVLASGFMAPNELPKK